MSVYSMGLWLVHPGRENDFVQAWRDLVRRAQENYPHTTFVLMHDREVPDRFISTEAWESLEQIEQWLASADFSAGMEAVRPSIEHFEPHTLDEAAAV